MATIPTKWYSSAMSGAPGLSGTAGSLISVLDACLLSGFGSVTLDSVVIESGVATATKLGHGFLDHVVVLIEGATPAALNGEKRITRVSGNVFMFDATGISNQTATGLITAKMAPVGWEKRYTAPSKAAYARTVPEATAMLLRIDDTPPQYPSLMMYERMDGIDSGVGPTAAVPFCKSLEVSLSPREWRLYADSQAFYLCVDTNNSNNWFCGLFFGDILPYKSTDAYHCRLIGSGEAGNNYLQFSRIGSTANSYFSRSYSQLGGAVAASQYSHVKTPAILGVGGQVYPNPVDNSVHFWPVEAWENTTFARGLMPGLWNPIHNGDAELTQGLIFSDVPALPNRKMAIQRAAVVTRMGFDLTGPWR